MWRPRPTARRAVALGCIALAAAGAGVAFAVVRDDKICTLIGGVTGVSVRLSEAHLRDTDRATVCVEGRCDRLRRRAPRSVMPVEASGPQVVQVVFILERRGEPADVRVMRTRLERVQPNGPDCPGTWWTAAVTSGQARPAG